VSGGSQVLSFAVLLKKTTASKKPQYKKSHQQKIPSAKNPPRTLFSSVDVSERIENTTTDHWQRAFIGREGALIGLLTQRLT
jgi:hypothetical protein